MFENNTEFANYVAQIYEEARKKKNADGTKNKSKVTDPKSGVKYEKYGHLSDCFDYALCLCINESWNKFRSSRKVLETTATPIYGTFNF